MVERGVPRSAIFLGENMKEFDLDSVFIMSEILDKTGFMVDLKKIVASMKTEEIENLRDAQKVGREVGVGLVVQIMGDLSKSIYKAQPEVKKLIAHMTDKKIEEVGKMSLKEIVSFFKELVNVEGFEDFLKQAVS